MSGAFPEHGELTFRHGPTTRLLTPRQRVPGNADLARRDIVFETDPEADEWDSHDRDIGLRQIAVGR